jgi:hypothetical protein
VRNPSESACVHPTKIDELLDEAVRAQRRVVRVVEDDVAGRKKVALPGMEVPTDALVGVIAVEPEEGNRLRPARREYLAAHVQQPHLAIRAGAHHVPVERGSVFRPELTSEGADEVLVRFDRVDGRIPAGRSPSREHDGRAPAIAADFDDATAPNSPREPVEEQGGIMRQPPFDRWDVTEVFGPALGRSPGSPPAMQEGRAQPLHTTKPYGGRFPHGTDRRGRKLMCPQ